MARTKAKPVEYYGPDKPTVNFQFKPKGGIQPKGFEEMTLEEDVAVLTKGKVTSASTDEWGKQFRLEVKSCEILAGDEQQRHMKDLLK
jgi:hypothetical protein